MEALINDRTRAIVINNPSNPCGSVYSKEHLQAILEVAERKKVRRPAGVVDTARGVAVTMPHSWCGLCS